jgi:hypothetical protein
MGVDIFDRKGEQIVWNGKASGSRIKDPAHTVLSRETPAADVVTLIELGLPVQMSAGQAIAASRLMADKGALAASAQRGDGTGTVSLEDRVSDAYTALYATRDADLKAKASALLKSMRNAR